MEKTRDVRLFGHPVEFFVSCMNGHYNRLRGLAQHFIDDRDLSLNITRLKSRITDDKRGFTVSKADAEHGLRGLVARAAYKQIKFTQPDFKGFCKELRRDSVDHLIAQPHIVEAKCPGSTGPAASSGSSSATSS